MSPRIPLTKRICWILAASLAAAAPAFADYTVTGRFQYEDREFNLNGFTGVITARPIRFADVRILAGSQILATGATREDGTYSVNVPSSTAQQITVLCVSTSTATPGILLDVRVANNNYTPGDYYSVSTQVNAPGSGSVDAGTTLASSSIDVGKVFNIWDVLIDAMQFVASPEANRSFPSQRLTGLWRADHPDTGSFFVPSTTSPYLYVGSSGAYDDTVISHEYGHFIDFVYSNSDSPGGVHYIGDNQQDMRLSWGEGLATFLGCSARRFRGYDRPEIYVDTDGTTLSFSLEIEYLTGAEVYPGSITGSTNEIAVSAALWDIVDGPDTADSTPGRDDDPLQLPFSDVWKVLTRYLTTVTTPGITIETFWNGWFASGINNGHLSEMQTVFSTVNGIEFVPDALEPDDSARQASPTSVAKVPVPVAGARVVINELDLGSDDAVELYNAGDTDADLSNWTLVATATVDGAPSRTTWVIPAFRLPAGGFVILSEASGTNTNFILYFNKDTLPGNNISWANGLPGSCLLKDSTGLPIDFVRWGGSAEPVPTGTGFAGPDLASPPAGKNLGRSFSGTDTDSSGDWTLQNPTLGSYNISGQERHHTYYPAGDVDYVAFNAISGRNYLVETLNLSNGADTVIDVISTDAATVLASNDDFGPWKSSRLQWTAPSSGTYYVRLTRFDGPSNLAQYGSYDFRVVESASNIPAPLPAVLTVSQPGQGGRFQSLSGALSAAANGDTIQILDSATYSENLSIFSARSVTLKAAAGKNPVLDGRRITSSPALNIVNAKTVRVEGLTIFGGAVGVQVSSGHVTLVNTVVNGASGTDGIRARGSASEVAIVNCTIANSVRFGVEVESSAAVRVSNSILLNNAGGDIGSDGTARVLTVRNSLLSAPAYVGSNGNIGGDPLFIDPGSGNFRLRAGSPAIDKGDPADPDIPPFDADGLPRSLDGTGSGRALPDMGAYEYLSPGLLSATAVFPQIAVGGSRNYRTSIVAINTNAVAATVNLTLTKSDATPFPAGVLSGPDNTWLAVPENGAAVRETAGTADLISGYARLLSSVPVSGTALFKTMSGNNIVSEAGVGLPKPSRSFTVYIDNSDSAYSGYALANYGTTTANLTLTLRDGTGLQKDVQLLSLPPGQHRAEFAFQRFASASEGFEGTIEFASDQPISAVALRYDNPAQDVFSTVPVLTDEAAKSLYFPQAADGGGYRTDFILVNPSDSPAIATLEFFANDGSPLAFPIGGIGRLTITVSLNPRGVARLFTDGTSADLRVGWVRVTSSAAIGGSAIFQTTSGGLIKSEAGVSSSPLTNHFVTFVESLGYAASGLAVSNPNSTEVRLTFNLRDSGGELVATRQLTLKPLGHTAQFFSGPDQLFPTGFDQFQGTLEVIADGQVVAVALRYDNFLADVFATLPVVLIQ